MSISYSTADVPVAAPKERRRLILLLIAINVGFALASVFWWTMMSLLVAEPIKWATWTGLGTTPELLDYPFNLLWMLPLSGSVVSWLLLKHGNRKVSLWSGFFPILFLGMMFAWYYLTPVEWR